MRNIKYILLVCAALIGGFVNAQSQKELGELMRNRGEYYFTLNVEDLVGIENLGEICSVDGTDGRIVVAYANQEEYNKLIALGLRPNLQTPPSLREEAKMWEGGDRATYEWNSYLTYEQYVSMMQGFPSQALSDRTCTLIDLGQLSTTNHRHLYGVRIYKGEPYGKPKFLYTSTMHGDEVTGMILMLRLIDELCTSTDTRIVNLLNDVDIYIFPCNNPDGTYAGGNNTVTGATRANGNSVDLNRNYKDYFNGDHPDNKNYQDETTWTMAHANENLFTMAANYHGGSELLNYCWDWVFQDHADMDWWEYVCTEYVQLARQVSSSYMGGYSQNSSNYDYDGVTNGATWYSITGSRQDYMNGYGQCREVTVECSNTKTPSASQLPNFWNYNHNSLLAFMEQARNGVHGVVYDATTSQTIQGVSVSVMNHDISNSYVTTHEVGDFHRPIKGGTYTFIFDKSGYARKFVEVTVADGQRVDLNVYLTPSNETAMECYEQVSAADIVTGPCFMGYLNGSTLVMPSHNDRSTSTSVSVSTTSLSVTLTDNGFTLPHDIDRQKIALEPSGTSGQYHIVYKGRMLQRSSSSLVWAKPSNASGNGVSLSPYNWHIDATGVYYQSGSTKYYLNYSNGSFATSTTNSNTITFYRERSCLPMEFTVTATANPEEGGTVEGAGTYLEGETCTMTATANDNYQFIKWTENGEVVSTENPYSFTVTGNRTLVAVFGSTIPVSINVSASPARGGSVSGGGEFLYGQNCTVTATANAGYNFINWTENGTVVSTEPTYSFEVEGERTLVANFFYAAAVPATDCYYPANNVSAGNYVMGYLNGSTLVMPSHNNASTVTTTSLNVVATDNGFSVASGTTVPEITLTAYGSNQYYISYNGRYLARSSGTNLTWGSSTSQYGRWYINSNGIYVTRNSTNYYLYYNNGSFALSTSKQNNITFYTEGDCPLLPQYAITAAANPAVGGTIDGADLYYQGETCILTATANEGYAFVNWTEGGEEVSNEATYSFEVTAERELVANFERSQTISMEAGWNWWTPSVAMTLGDLESLLDGHAILINSQNEGFARYDGQDWSGTLTEIVAGQMYRILTNSETEFTMSGAAVTSMVTLLPGYNWFGYMGTQPTAVATALGDFTPTDGDKIVDKDGNTTTYNDENWTTDSEHPLTMLYPGHGYVYHSNATQSKTITFE